MQITTINVNDVMVFFVEIEKDGMKTYKAYSPEFDCYYYAKDKPSALEGLRYYINKKRIESVTRYLTRLKNPNYDTNGIHE